ncbi:ATP-binding protein [Helcobacillus massiliensis]|uniref:sensor histidine kinase n=1 Tax=Helcobacillus TaxID=1161125 RepID=UPI001EF5430A|nr:ATP-binding protein [Helcobacillus massiliensis]MCG7427400.1 ATP-binding protein [Helcobacillus sp. ACRRO]MCT1557973.1 ATP-binding protein [Helcobacillus massiliensis]MCT2037049.1 ATP-binding protein [Helcobacillus massiliensis]MCT2332829.1 ATP-binding protein [Helcobacillus massiliensis]
MDLLFLLIAGAIGVVFGVAAMVALQRNDSRRTVDMPRPHQAVADVTSEILTIISTAHVLLDRTGDVVRASPLAFSYGIVRATNGDYPRLASPVLIDMVTDVGSNGGYRDQTLELSRSHEADGTGIISVKIGTIGADHVLLLADDLTRATRVEATRRDFVANVSHELKTPVGALALLAETMEDAADDPVAVRRFAQRMQSESTRLSSLVREIIELSRIQGSSALQDADEVSMADVAEQAITVNQTVAEGAGIRLVNQAQDDLLVYGNRSMLITALSNLIANAVTYSPKSSTVTICSRRHNGMIEVSVRDQGMGISPEDLERVFERFFRVDKARSRARGGSGLGLAIVKHIANDHGGSVNAQSVLDAGSTFTLQIPELSVPVAAGARMKENS